MSEPAPVWKVPTVDLSDRQIAIMAAIKDHVERWGWPPSVREIGLALGISSTSVVSYHLRKLAALGYIELGHGARTIRIVTQGRE